MGYENPSIYYNQIKREINLTLLLPFACAKQQNTVSIQEIKQLLILELIMELLIFPFFLLVYKYMFLIMRRFKVSNCN